MKVALTSGAIAATFALVIFIATHYLSERLFGELGKLICYTIGLALIGLLFGIWCLVQPAPIPAIWAFVAFCAIVTGAGLGTLISHAIDAWTGTHAENKVLKARVGDE